MERTVKILHTDRCFLVCLKPPGIVSTDCPGGLPEQVRRTLGDGNANLRTVHRLDAATGGLMVLARTKQAAQILSRQVAEHGFGKEYFALAQGTLPQCGTMEDLLGRDTVRRMTYVAREPGKDVRPAKLTYEVLDRRDGISLVRVFLHTGRTHQIRVQFASRQWPLVGDRKYGNGDGAQTMGLWACRLEFSHPFTHEPMSFFAPPPAEGIWAGFEESIDKEERSLP